MCRQLAPLVLTHEFCFGSGLVWVDLDWGARSLLMFRLRSGFLCLFMISILNLFCLIVTTTTNSIVGIGNHLGFRALFSQCRKRLSWTRFVLPL